MKEKVGGISTGGVWRNYMKHLLLLLVGVTLFSVGFFNLKVVEVNAQVDDSYYMQPYVSIRYVEVYVEVPQQLTDWESLDELKAFIAADDSDTTRIIKLNSEGRGGFDNSCVDQAERLRDRAAEIGRHLEVLVVSPMEYKRLFGKTKDTYDAVSLARIDDYYYVVEPTTDIIKRAYKIP